MEEPYAFGVAAMFAADTELEVRIGLSAPFTGYRNKLSHTGPVQHLEGVFIEDATLQIGGQEATLSIVAGEAAGGLGEVVGAEGEEACVFRDPAGGSACPRQLYHGADLHRMAAQVLSYNRLYLFAGLFELAREAHERDHDLHDRREAFLLHGPCGLGDGLCLHAVDLRPDDA